MVYNLEFWGYNCHDSVAHEAMCIGVKFKTENKFTGNGAFSYDT